MPLRLVHLSDIHFQGYGAGWDEDADQRAELVRDLRAILGVERAVSGIVVGGDIAFSAEPDEYATAKAWLDEVCGVCEVDSSRVWVIPGNHDVSRSVIGRSAAARDFRRTVKGCAADGVDQELRSRLSTDPAGEGVMVPFSNYNDFAGQFGCGTTAQQPHWFDDTLECDGRRVRLTGMNSALVSDSLDSKDDDQHKLVLGTWQCTLPRQDGVVHVAVSHHPPAWLRDWHLVEPYLRRAHIILFGHEHQFAAEQSAPGGTVYVYAGAVGPERLGGSPDDEYLPSWGLITIACADESLDVSVEPRVWHRAYACFGPHPDGLLGFEVRVDLAEGRGHAEKEGGEDESAGIAASPLTSPAALAMSGETAPTASQRRSLGLRFMSLPESRRLEIARTLGVFEEPIDFELSKPKRYETILTRIRERDLIERLQEELDRA